MKGAVRKTPAVIDHVGRRVPVAAPRDIGHFDILRDHRWRTRLAVHRGSDLDVRIPCSIVMRMRWLLTELGYQPFQDWPGGRSWRLGSTYVRLEQSSDLTADRHDRHRPGLNHLAFHAGDRAEVDRLADAAVQHGWTLLFSELHPYAGGPGHHAAFIANSDGYEAELVAATQ